MLSFAISVLLGFLRQIDFHVVISGIVSISTNLVQPVFVLCQLLHPALSLRLNNVLFMVFLSQPISERIDSGFEVVSGHVCLLLVLVSLLVPLQPGACFFHVLYAQLGWLTVLSDVKWERAYLCLCDLQVARATELDGHLHFGSGNGCLLFLRLSSRFFSWLSLIGLGVVGLLRFLLGRLLLGLLPLSLDGLHFLLDHGLHSCHLERVQEEPTFCFFLLPLEQLKLEINRVVEAESLGLAQVV